MRREWAPRLLELFKVHELREMIRVRVRELLEEADAWDLMATAAARARRPIAAAGYQSRAAGARLEAGRLLEEARHAGIA